MQRDSNMVICPIPSTLNIVDTTGRDVTIDWRVFYKPAQIRDTSNGLKVAHYTVCSIYEQSNINPDNISCIESAPIYVCSTVFSGDGNSIVGLIIISGRYPSNMPPDMNSAIDEFLATIPVFHQGSITIEQFNPDMTSDPNRISVAQDLAINVTPVTDWLASSY